jgi:hypothetical protein
MIFLYRDKRYLGKTAVKILREVEQDTEDYLNKNGTIQDFLNWSMKRLSDRIPQRELDVSPRLADETLAFNYLCLLDNYRIGMLYTEEISLNQDPKGYGNQA